MTLDLRQRRPSAYLAVNQREWSPTYARETFGRPEDSARIKDYRVYASNDGRHWGKPVRTGALRSARGTQFIDIGQQHARYLKLEVLNTWGGPQAPTFLNQLRIDEIKVAHSYPVSWWRPAPLEAERAALSGSARPAWCPACSGSLQVTGLGRGAVTYRDVTVASAGDYRLQIDHTSGAATSLAVSVNGAPAVAVPVAADRADAPSSTAIVVPLRAGANTVRLSSAASRGPGVDRIAVAPLPPASYVPKTTMTVEPGGVQWVGPGQQSIKISAKLRLDVDDTLDQVTLAPAVPAGWMLTGAPVRAASMRLGQELTGTWTATSPAGQDVSSADVPVTAWFQTLGRANAVTKDVRVRLRPADRVFMREAEDSQNALGSSGITGCSPCSGGQKVRNIGGTPDAHVVFGNVTVATAGEYTLFIDYTVNGDRSFFVSANGGAPVEARVSGIGNNRPETTSVRITLKAGTNTLRVYNDQASAPDLDRLSLG